MKYGLGLNIIVDEELKEEELTAIQKQLLEICKHLTTQLNRNICFILYKNDESKSGLVSVNFINGVLTVNDGEKEK
jgi:hypothetical protein